MMVNEANGGLETVLIAYGSNLSPGAAPASQAFARVVKSLSDRGLIITKISRLWRSEAWPDPSDPPYVNAVMAVQSSHSPHEILKLLHDVEREAGRVRDGRRNAPRVLDLDLVAYGNRVIEREGLVLPHPRAAERGFVMGPLAEILPDWVHPVLQKTGRELLENITVGLDAHPMN